MEAALKRKRPRADGDAQKTVVHERPFLSSTGRGAFFLFRQGGKERMGGAETGRDGDTAPYVLGHHDALA